MRITLHGISKRLNFKRYLEELESSLLCLAPFYSRCGLLFFERRCGIYQLCFSVSLPRLLLLLLYDLFCLLLLCSLCRRGFGCFRTCLRMLDFLRVLYRYGHGKKSRRQRRRKESRVRRSPVPQLSLHRSFLLRRDYMRLWRMHLMRNRSGSRLG